MANKVFVGNVSFKATEEDVSEFFEGCGAVVSVKLIMDRETGKSKGFAFVEMADREGFEAAMQCKGQKLMGREIHVDEARPPQQHGKRREE